MVFPIPSLPVRELRPQAHWRMIALLALFIGGISTSGWILASEFLVARPPSSLVAEAMAAPDKTLPNDLMPVSRPEAEAINAAIPLTHAPVMAASGFYGAAAPADFATSLECLTAALYYEAAGQGEDGLRAVAQVVLNRMRHPAYPHNVCGVVFQGSERSTGCQFTFTCDGSLARVPSRQGWAQARRVAAAALSGSVYAPVGWATHYHADYVVPKWASSLDKVAVVGAHIFYRWRGNAGQGSAFTAHYAGNESNRAWIMAAAAANAAPALDQAVAGPQALPVIPVARPLRGSEAADSPLMDAPARWAIRQDGETAQPVQQGVAELPLR